jgi:Phosphoribosyl-ATP pyrophosphohydrolase
MQNQLLQVAAFMRLMGQPVRWSPAAQMTVEEVKLRIKLGAEEQDEFIGAFVADRTTDLVNVDKVEALDALCDRLYILLGDVHALGFGFVYPAAFRRVHESNMTKLWTTAEKEAAERTVTNLTFEKVDVKGDRCWLARNQIGKVMKSPSYQPALLKEFLDELEGQELLSFDCAKKIIYGDAPEPDIEEVFAECGKESDDEVG